MGTAPKLWHTVPSVYRATDEEDLTTADRSEVLEFEDGKTGGTLHSYPLTMFICQLRHGVDGSVHQNDRQGRPDISPYAKRQAVLPATEVFEDPEDFLLPLQPYNDLAVDPDECFRSRPGGKKHVEMVLIRNKDVESANLEMRYRDFLWLQRWKLKNHPFVQLDDGGKVNYRVIRDVWWLLLTPYDVSMGNGKWEDNKFRPSEYNPTGQMRPREVANPLTKKLVEKLPVFQRLLPESSKRIRICRREGLCAIILNELESNGWLVSRLMYIVVLFYNAMRKKLLWHLVSGRELILAAQRTEGGRSSFWICGHEWIANFCHR